MGVFNRLSVVIQAKLNRLVESVEDPRETLDLAYEKQLELLQEVKRGLVDVATAKGQLKRQAVQIERDINMRNDQARRAVDAGRDDLALTAVERRLSSENDLQRLTGQIDEMEAEQAKLVKAEQRLQARVDAFRSKKEIIKAQYSAAQAQERINSSLTGVGSNMNDAVVAAERAEGRTNAMRARAGAIDELVEAGTLRDITSPKDDIDRELAKLTSSGAAESELEKIKAGRRTAAARAVDDEPIAIG